MAATFQLAECCVISSVHIGNNMLEFKYLVWTLFILINKVIYQGQDSSVSITTGCRLDGWGLIPSRDKRMFSVISRLALGNTQPALQCVPAAVSPGIKRPVYGFGLLPPSGLSSTLHTSSWQSA
jgi:hypothetical protein